MKDRRRRDGPWGVGRGLGGRPLTRKSASSAPTLTTGLFTFLLCALFATVAFSAFRIFQASSRPVLISRWQTSAISAVTAENLSVGQELTTTSSSVPPVLIREAISFPDEVLLFLKFPLFVPDSKLLCLYYSSSNLSSSSLNPKLRLPPIISSSPHPFFLRCPLVPRSFSISLSPEQSPLYPCPWDHLAYSAILDTQDNSTVVFAKGLNLRPGRLSDPFRYECVFGWRFSNPKYLITSPALSAAQEIFRCKTPPSILPHFLRKSKQELPLVSVKTKGRRAFTLPTVAQPETLQSRSSKEHLMCICTMVRNQARFLQEWIIYHAHIGVEGWFIYDNNSDDGIKQVIESMNSAKNYNVSLYSWPWIKTQEAGFAHCALRARDHCEWVGFIDVDEFLHLPIDVTLHDVLRNYSSIPWVGELRTACYSFGPSGRKTIPTNGVIMGYTCRVTAPERHKSIIRPEALNPSLINIVHHFHLKDGMKYVNMEKGIMVINHYKYQVWEVFKEKFYRRVATYVADWQEEENVGSKDRAPGLGTKAVEPPDWSSRFCEVKDTGLRDKVLKAFIDPQTRVLSW